jgi:hypothetical protein
MHDFSSDRPLFVPHSILIVFAIFIAVQAALLIGLSTPETFVFDEVHYVPAARQMLRLRHRRCSSIRCTRRWQRS